MMQYDIVLVKLKEKKIQLNGDEFRHIELRYVDLFEFSKTENVSENQHFK